MTDKQPIWATGKRKTSKARVRLFPGGTGKVVINKKSIEDYFGRHTLRAILRQPLVATNNEGKYDVHVTIDGGGISSQAEAIRHGIARALVNFSEEMKPELKKHGFLTRDPREKERRKVGCRKARRRPQFSKR